jgi:hypothetical protein
MATKISSIKKIDKIVSLNHNAGFINMGAGSIVSIGGLQYTTDGVKSVLLSSITLTANGRFQIYAVISGGDVILVLSTNENSVGPAGYTSWKLVGSFYANSQTSIGFGGFINIKGLPSASVDDSGSATLVAAFVGFPAFTLTQYMWTRLGKVLKVSIRLDSVTGNASPVRIPIPRGGLGTSEVSTNLGTFAGQNGSGNAGGGSVVSLGSLSTDVSLAGPTGLSGAAISVIVGTQVVGAGAPSTVVAHFHCEISQWSNTPIEDL